MVSLIPQAIHVVGADANNLQDVDVAFPLGSISMVVGVSGSGKSSLLRDVLAVEGNQRLKEFLGISQDHLGLPMNRAFVDALPATLHVGQRAFRASSRTTVATASGLLSLLRHMFVQWSLPVSQVSGSAAAAPTAENYARWLLQHHQGKLTIWAIPMSFVANDGVAMAAKLAGMGFESAIVRSESDTPKQWELGRDVRLNPFKPLSKRSRHVVEVLAGKLDLSKRTEKNEMKLLELLTLAFQAGEGRVFVETHKNQLPDLQGAQGVGLDSRKHWITPADPRIYRPADIHLLSFNAPEHEASGACPTCKGLGTTAKVDVDQLIAHPNKSMHEGACALWTTKNYKFINIQHDTIEGLRGIEGFDPNQPWYALPESARNLVLYGSGSQLVADVETGTGRKMSKPRVYPGLFPAIMKHVTKGTKIAERLAFLIRQGRCETCRGTRWSHAAKALNLGGRNIADLLDSNFAALAEICAPSGNFAKALPAAAKPYLNQLRRLAQSLVGVGLAHLNGARSMLEISEGESRRIRLAAVFDGRHQGLGLLLDEPARGLHDEDVMRLAETLKSLRGQHTLIINDHRQRLALGVDHFVQLGPGGGPEGGKVIYQGKVPQSWWQVPDKLQRSQLQVEEQAPHLHIYGACRHNLRNQDVRLPLGKLICITGLSGSGKSSFVHGVLKPALQNPQNTDLHGWQRIEGHQQIEQVISLDQGTPPANRRSLVATSLDIAKDLRNYYAALPQAKKHQFQARDFGLNGGDGRCSKCLGIGETQDGSQWVTCASCGGLRFQSNILSIYDHGLNIAQLLDLSIAALLQNLPPVLACFRELLQSICQLGLGHLALGRRVDTLSGGEIQRLRIANQLNRQKGKGSLFLLDEPAAGLHKNDVANLLQAVNYVVANCTNTVVLVEHNLSIVAASDWVIEFGPGSGPDGGIVVAAGTPQQIAKMNTATGRMLKNMHQTEAPQPRQAVHPIGAKEQLNKAHADANLRWLRRLLGHDIAPVSEPSQGGASSPIVVFEYGGVQEQPLMQYGGLDRHLLSFALENHTQRSDAFRSEYFLDLWRRTPESQLVIQPLLQDIFIWGRELPHNIVKRRLTYLKQQGYDILQHQSDLAARATAKDFQCATDTTHQQREQVLAKALAIGAGYVELQHKGACIGRYGTRLVDLQHGVVGPLAMSPYDFLLKGERGKCPACKGSGKQFCWDLHLIFVNRECSILDKGLFSASAMGILKGVHRNVLTPFLKMMIKEGLWPADDACSKWTQAQWNLVLYGFWSRPGPGSFLKNAKANPYEVASWLRWDGLYAHIQQNLERADIDWANALKDSRKEVDCPVCNGLGLQSYAGLLQLGDRSYSDWILHGTVTELHHWLDQCLLDGRQQQNSLCLKAIMEQLIQKGFGNVQLFKPAPQQVYHALVPSLVQAFTHMPLIIEKSR
jgi:excinuclease ABC A subunit